MRMRISVLFTILKYKLKLVIPEYLWTFIYKITLKKIYDDKHFQEKTILKSSLPIEFFIIRRRPPGAGLFSNVFHVIQRLIRFEELNSNKKLQPIVDFENYYMDEMHNLVDFPVKNNAWTNYFNQLSSFELKDVYRNHSYILSEATYHPSSYLLSKDLGWVYNREKVEYISSIIQRYIEPNSIIQAHMDKFKETIDWNPNSTLALGVRGGTYVKYRYPGHPIQANVAEVIPVVEKYLKNYDIHKVYLQTHDYQIYEDIVKRFGSLIVKSFALSKYNTLQEFTDLAPKDRPYHWDKVPKLSFEDNFRYMIDIYMMSEAKFLVASLTNGIAFAIAKNGNRFLERTIISKGHYE